MSAIIGFLAIALVINLTPGPAMLYCIGSGVRGGTRGGILASLGVESGVFLYVVATALGLAALLVSAAPVYLVIRAAGVIYLLYLAWTSIPLGHGSPDNLAVAGGEPVGRPFLRGFLLNVSNPKIAIFFLTLLPQFVPSQQGNEIKLIILGVLFNLSGLTVNITASLLGNRLAPAVSRLGPAQLVLPWIPPVVFDGLAMFSAWEIVRSL